MILWRRLTSHDVKRRAGNGPSIKGLNEVTFMNQPASRRVDLDRAFLHAGKFRGDDEAGGLGCRGTVKGYDIRLFDDLIK